MSPLIQNGPDLLLKNNKVCGASLIEIVLACIILVFALIPIYRSFTSHAETEIEGTLISIAKEILSSLRQEVMARSFDEIKNMVAAGATANNLQPLQGQPYPAALANFYNAQKRYKDRDFKLDVKAGFTNPPKNTIIQIEANVTFKFKQKELTEKLSFMKISEK